MSTLKKIFLAFTPKERLVFWIACALLVISAGGLLTLFIRTATVVVPTRGGEYTEGVVGQPAYVNPVLASSEADQSLVHLLFGNVNQMAEKIEVQADGRTWSVRLKQGLTWSDNHKLTSDDLIFTVQKIQDPETHSPLFESFQGVSANRVSELEVEFVLTSPYPFFSENLAHLYLLPKHLFVDTPASNWKLSEYNLKPVGNGPFVFESYDKQPNGFVNTYRLASNPRFAEGEPLIDRVNLVFFTRPEEAVREFNSGAIQGFATFDPNLLTELNRSYGLHSFKLPSYYAVFLNQTKTQSVFKESVVREAMSAAIDREALKESALRGHGVAVTSPLLPFLISEESASGTISREEAVSALDEAGWKIGPDGVRAKGDKRSTTTLAFTLTVPRIPFLLTTAQNLVEQWMKIGVKATIASVPPEEIIAKSIKNRDYDAILFGNVLNPPTDLYSFWHSNERFYPGLNLSLYSNKSVDQFIETIRREFDDSKRKSDLLELRDMIVGDSPAVFLYSPDYLFISSKDLKGVEDRLLTTPSDRYQSIGEWHLRTTRTLK